MGRALDLLDPRRRGFWNLPFGSAQLAALGAAGLILSTQAQRLRQASWILGGVNLYVHEWGHAIFGVAGIEPLTVMGGTLAQLLLPTALMFYFLSRGQRGGSFCLLWLGQNFLDVGVYIADARANAMPKVVGVLMMPAGIDGRPVEGDWTYLLEKLGLSRWDIQLGHGVEALGCLIIALAGYAAFSHLSGRPQPTAAAAFRRFDE